MKIRHLIFTALFAALTAIGAFLKIPFGVSSFTLQFLFTAMAGILLGWKYGALSQAVYVLLGIIGIPIFTQGGGFSYVFQPTFGFLLGLIPAALVIGLICRKSRNALIIAGSCVVGLAVLYLVGLPYMGAVLNLYLGKNYNLSQILWAGMIPFLPGDAVKIIVCAVICPVLKKRMTPLLDKAD